MAMGVSSIQAKPFRPCSPSYFSLLQSSPRYSYMIFSSRSSASSKALHRRETCIVRSCFPNITMSNTSIQFRQDIFYRNYSLVEGRPVGSKTSSVVNIREDTKGEFQNFPDGRDGAYSESDSTNSKDTWSGTQNARSRVQPYIQDQVFAQSGKHEVDTVNVGSYVRHYGDSKSVSVKVKSHKIDGSEKINLFPVQCLGKAVKYNQMESNMEVKSSIGSERRIDKAFDTNGRDSGKTSFKFTNHSSESEITRTDPNALLKEVSMIHSDQGVKYKKPSLFQTQDTWSITPASKAVPQPHMHNQTFLQNGKQVNGHRTYGSYKLVLSSAPSLEKTVKSNEIVSEKNMGFGTKAKSVPSTYEALKDNSRSVTGKKSIKKPNGHGTYGSDKLVLSSAQSLEKTVKSNEIVSQKNMRFRAKTKAVPSTYEALEDNSRDVTGKKSIKKPNGHRTYGLDKLVPPSAQSLEKTVKSNEIVSQKNMRFRAKTKAVPSTYEALEDNSRDVTGKKSIKKPNGHRTYGSDKLVLSSAQSLEKTFKSNEIVSQKNMGFRAKTKFVPSTYESLKDSSRNVTGKKSIKKPNGSSESEITRADLCARLTSIYSKVLVVDNVPIAKDVVRLLTGRYRHLVHACDTEVAKINVKQETPVDHGEVICFSIYSGPQADFGNGKSYVWVDVLDGGGKELLLLFAAFFEDPSIKKVWHNYSFDNHVIENYGLNLSGFHADTMHMARLWDSSRWAKGGYSLEALTGDPKVMSGAELDQENNLFGKISMKTIFGRKKTRKDGNEGKFIGIGPVEELQRNERIPWICYSALDAISTLKLYESLKKQLSNKPWHIDGNLAPGKSMFDFYEKFWRPFGEVLVKMETEGMLVDRVYLAEIEQWAKAEQKVAVNCFRKWASKYCADAMYMNVGSDAQLRQLLFGGTMNSKDQNQSLPLERKFKYKNVDNVVEEGKKAPLKYRNMTIQSIGVNLKTAIYTPAGWPSVSGGALKVLAGKVAAEFDFLEDDRYDDDIGNNSVEITAGVLEEKLEKPISSYGTAFEAFENPEDGKEACHAIANVCRTCSIDTLIYNFILPLQSSNISGRNGRIHCSLNINTQTGRLSARRPNLQNQPALEKDRYKIRQAFIAAPGNSLIVADYGQLELRILAHLTNCKSMLDAFKVGGDFHSRTALNMYPHLREAIEEKQVLLEWDPQPGEDKPPVPLLKDVFASERKKAKQLNFSIAYGKTPVGLARDWNVSVEEAMETLDLWYNERKEVLTWQEQRKEEAHRDRCVRTLLGRTRWFPSLDLANYALISHIERAAINTPVQGSAADVAMCAMLEISNNARLKELGWRLLLQVHDEVILEGPSESSEVAKDIVVECMSKPFGGANFLKVDLVVDAKCAQNWYAAK